MIRPEVGADPDVVAAMMIAAIDQHIADAGGAHLAEGDFLRVVGGHGPIIKNPAPPREFRRSRRRPGRLVCGGDLPATSRAPGPTRMVPPPKAGAPSRFNGEQQTEQESPAIADGALPSQFALTCGSRTYTC